ncbi:MAG: AbrB/MazE/SpoVT family DNA-binding domain-containing protein [Caldilineaceae bacterium]
MLDKAGRIHIPHDYLEQFNFGQRVRIEATEDGIVIRPALAQNGEANGAADDNVEDADLETEDAAPKSGRIRGLFGRFGRKKNTSDEE